MHESEEMNNEIKVNIFSNVNITIVASIIIVFIGLIIYDEFTKADVANKVEEFVSNIKISNEKTN